jgi:hypothetical protein
MAKDPRRVAAGRIGALRLHGLHDSAQLTKVARAGIIRKFRAEAAAAAAARGERPTDEELDRRALSLRKAHMTKLAYKREEAKRRKKKTAGGGSPAVLEEVAGAGTTAALPEAV